MFVLSSGCSRIGNNNTIFGKRPVAFGDSWTLTGTYPARLSELIGVPVINFGKNGEVTKWALLRLNNLMELNPSSVIVEFGINDLNRYGPEFYEYYMRKLLSTLKNKNIRCMILTVPYVRLNPTTRGSQNIPTFNNIIFKLGKEYSIPVCDINSAIFNEFKPELYENNIHANEKGYRKMAEYIYKCGKKTGY